MGKLKLIGAMTALALGAMAMEGRAEERKLSFSTTITAASDYMFRGISYTDEDPTVNIYNANRPQWCRLALVVPATAFHLPGVKPKMAAMLLVIPMVKKKTPHGVGC